MRQLVINTQERAISTDINRLQLFKEKNLSELFRFWLDAIGSDDDTTGVITEPNTIETPLRAEIINGLMVTPAVGTTDITITPGLAFVMNPDAAPDLSNYKYVADAGIPSPGTLSIAAGSGGATRIDVIECQINSIDTIVTDNRDIFNATTGLFGVATVTKERERRLTYRVRQGTPGAGMPANQAGWLPLCVASVPSTSVNNDTVTFWDVRPLIADRLFGAFNNARLWSPFEQLNYTIDSETTPGSAIMNGQVKVGLGARRLGGYMRRGTPGTDANNVDLLAAANLDPAWVAPVQGRFFYVYLMTPFGLPRWARYTDATSGSRLPRAPRGLLVSSNIAPTHMTGQPSAGVGLPASTGLGGTHTTGICIAAPVITAVGPLKASGIGEGLVHWLGSNGGAAGAVIKTPSSSTSAHFDFTMTPGTDFPANAKAVYVAFQNLPTMAAGASWTLADSAIQTLLPGGTNPVHSQPHDGVVPVTNTLGGSTTIGLSTSVARVPVPNVFPGAGAAWTLRWFINSFVNLVGATTPNPQAIICGWEF